MHLSWPSSASPPGSFVREGAARHTSPPLFLSLFPGCPPVWGTLTDTRTQAQRGSPGPAVGSQRPPVCAGPAVPGSARGGGRAPSAPVGGSSGSPGLGTRPRGCRRAGKCRGTAKAAGDLPGGLRREEEEERSGIAVPRHHRSWHRTFFHADTFGLCVFAGLPWGPPTGRHPQLRKTAPPQSGRLSDQSQVSLEVVFRSRSRPAPSFPPSILSSLLPSLPSTRSAPPLPSLPRAPRRHSAGLPGVRALLSLSLSSFASWDPN